MERASDILRIISARKAAGEPFALATVVRTVSATAAKASARYSGTSSSSAAVK